MVAQTAHPHYTVPNPGDRKDTDTPLARMNVQKLFGGMIRVSVFYNSLLKRKVHWMVCSKCNTSVEGIPLDAFGPGYDFYVG